MTHSYITLKEASKQTGKAKSTLRAWLNRHKETSTLLDSGDTVPVVKQIDTPNGKTYVLLEEYFLKDYADNIANDTTDSTASSHSGVDSEVIQILREQLQKKDEQIGSLSERLRESNVIINNLNNNLSTAQKQLESSEAKKKRGFLARLFNKNND